MSALILKPAQCEAAYTRCAEIVQKMYLDVTGKLLSISEEDDGVSDLFVIGSDSVNDFVMNEILELNIESPKIRYGTDDYSLISYTKNGRRILIFAGGRGRSTIYAAYDFFERFADCHYFWDGDVIGKKQEIVLDDFCISESPRFEYRGLRYFAHRGLKRFQAEHWSFDDWKRELDWMMKKRLNFFMLRIGMDDVWQRAFPNDVKYPDSYTNIKDEKGYDDRSDFWALKYRGKLREDILCYARELDLIYPTDCGTMTHWYSRTPKDFLDNKKPSFLPQHCKQYVGNDSGKVFDFREKENMDNYMQLTETMVQEYEKRTDYFHTIGLGERWIYEDRKQNHTLKLVAYRRIAENIRKRFPSSKLFIASWDFIGWWSSEEVKALTRELDPERTIILDYTSEVNDPDQGFLNWGVVNKFPWIFGLFHAYESESELRGPYKRTAERLKVAADDPYCKGMILWPELSHSDPVVLEYLSENAWSPLKNTVEEMVSEFCKKRYGKNHELLNSCWQSFLPFMMQGDWGGYSQRKDGEEQATEFYNHWLSHSDLWVKPFDSLPLRKDMRYKKQVYLKITSAKACLDDVISVIKDLASYTELWNDTFFKRDAIDIIRTACGRFLNFLLVSSYYDENSLSVENKKRVYLILHDALKELLGENDDFSLYSSLEELRAVSPVNPDFEKTLKQNIGNSYCRQFCYELMDTLFKKEAALLFDWNINGRNEEELPSLMNKKTEIFESFMKTPLSQLKPEKQHNASKISLEIADVLEQIKDVL